MLSRKKMRTSETITAVGAVAFFIGFLMDLAPLWIVGFAVILSGLALYAYASRCTKCGKMLRHVSSSLLDPGYCPHCGTKIEFDE